MSKKRNSEVEVEPEGDEFEVEDILDFKYVKGKGYPPEDNTWEPEENMINISDLTKKMNSMKKAYDSARSSSRKLEKRHQSIEESGNSTKRSKSSDSKDTTPKKRDKEKPDTSRSKSDKEELNFKKVLPRDKHTKESPKYKDDKLTSNKDKHTHRDDHDMNLSKHKEYDKQFRIDKNMSRNNNKYHDQVDHDTSMLNEDFELNRDELKESHYRKSTTDDDFKELSRIDKVQHQLYPEEAVEVEDLLDYKPKFKKDYFLVRWKGDWEDSWEPRKNLLIVGELMNKMIDLKMTYMRVYGNSEMDDEIFVIVQSIRISGNATLSAVVVEMTRDSEKKTVLPLQEVRQRWPQQLLDFLLSRLRLRTVDKELSLIINGIQPNGCYNMLNSYSLRSLSVVLSTPLKYELSRTLFEIKKAFEIAKHQNKNIGSVEYSYIPRKRWRVTYLKSRFKYRRAIRHYVFEQYNYNVTAFNPFDVDVLMASILGSLSPSVHARCTFSWNYPCFKPENSNLINFNVKDNKIENSVVNRLLSNLKDE